MIDIFFTAATLAFFAVALAYTAGCERLRGGKDTAGAPAGGSHHD